MPPTSSSLALALLAVSCGAVAPEKETPAAAQRLTLDDVIELSSKLKLRPGINLGWLPDGEHYLAAAKVGTSKEDSLVVVEAKSGTPTMFSVPGMMERAFASQPGVSAEDAKKWSARTDFTFDEKKESVLLDEASDLFVWRRNAESAVRITSDPADEELATFSPDGKLVAFVRDNNLFVASADAGGARALTTEGDANHLLGKLDWVYQEEVYGRGNFRSYWWSPDSRRIAFLALDETQVPEYTIVDHRETHPKVEVWRYPKAGDPNPRVTLHVVDVAGGPARAIDLGLYPIDDRLVVRVGWTPDSAELVFQVQNRIQTWLDLVSADPSSGAAHRLMRDSTKTWSAPADGFEWIESGKRFLWLSERDGYQHLYLYERDGTLVRRLTEGDWEVDTLHGMDEAKGVVYFTGDKEDVRGEQLYRVALDGSGLAKVTDARGTHAVSISPTWSWFTDTFSSASEFPRADLCSMDGKRVRALDRVDDAPAKQHGFVAPEFVQVKTRDGFTMEAMMIKPAGFDPKKRYPVICNTYSGPHAPYVHDAAPNFNAYFHQMLAQEGYLIWTCDNRSASGKGLASAGAMYKDAGSGELADLEDGLDWLVAQGYADPERVGLWGWSYGGYMTSFALTHSKRFKVGIAGAPVTDWHNYDSIYTEHLMDLPSANPEGYAKSSVTLAAANLSGRLLVIHGTIDENVHMQNSMQLAKALQEAGKLFDMMLYPGNRHPVTDPEQKKHLYMTIADYFRRNL